MGRVEGSLPYQSAFNLEGLKKWELNGLGCVIVVINTKGEIFAVKELQKGGVSNLISETRREGESIWQNVVGGLIEEIGIEDYDKPYFNWIEGRSYLGRVEFPKPNLKVHADVVCILYTGDKTCFNPRQEVKDEVEPLGFFSIQEIVNLPNFRVSTRPSLEMLTRSGLLESIIEQLDELPLRQLLNGIPTEAVFLERQKHADLIISN